MSQVVAMFVSVLTDFMVRLEAEIEEARMKANEEALAEIQVAKEEAQKELNEQKTDFEDQLKHLSEKLVIDLASCVGFQTGFRVGEEGQGCARQVQGVVQTSEALSYL